MAEVKVEDACEGESVESERRSGLSLPRIVDPLFPDNFLTQEEVSKTLGETMTAPSVSVEPESKDFSGLESIIPLSPQWLFSKNDGKPPMTPIQELPQVPVSASNETSNDSVLKEKRRAEGNRDAEKRRDWWRNMATDAEGSAGNRRERWREDERESSLLGRRDRWKDGGESNDRRVDRWAENSSNARESSENRRAPHSERRSDSANRETSHEPRRDSKWNTRWGPEDKEKETRRDKRLDSEKEGEGHRDKQHTGTLRNNEADRDMDTSARDRWRSHSVTARSKGEVPPPSNSPPPKAAPGFGIGRGRGNTLSAGFAIGRGRANLSGINPLHGMFSSIGSPPGIEQGDDGSHFRYPRAKLLDIYRRCSGSFSNQKYPEEFCEVPHLTQANPFEPLAFFTPDMDEEAVIEGILKGDVITSGAVYATPKEQTINKARENSGWNRARGRTVGNKEGGVPEAIREDAFSIGNLALREDSKPQNGVVMRDDTSVGTGGGQASGDPPGPFCVKETSDVNTYSHTAGESCKQESILESKESKASSNLAGNQESREFLSSVPASKVQGTLDLGGKYDEVTESLEMSIYSHLKKNSEDYIWSRSEGKKGNLSSPIAAEDLSLFYVDPQGVVQGPFTGVEIIDWFKAGFFGTDLMVRTADAPENTPFTQLSKIMPHLQGTTKILSTGDMSKYDVEYDESNVRSQVPSTPKYVQQSVIDSSEGTMRSGNERADGGHFSVINEEGRDMTLGQVSGRERGTAMSDEAAMLKRASSLPQKKAALPQRKNDDLQSFVQHWSERSGALPEKPGLILRNAGHLSNRVEFSHGAPDLFLPPGASPSLERSWSDLSPVKETLPHHLPSHALDALHMHHLQQLEMHRVQQQLDHGVPLSHVLQQQHLRQQSLAEHLLKSGHVQHDLSPHSVQQLASPRMPQRLQHQQSFPIQAPESPVNQLWRLQHLEPAPSHTSAEQLLGQHLLGLDHRHGLPVLTDRQLRRLHEASRTDNQGQQFEHLLQGHAHELLRQRQQEHEARQHALLIQQMASMHEQRVSGVWEVDEFGQFVRPQVANPIHSPEVFHQQWPQRHQNFSPMQHPGVSHGGTSGGHNSQLRLSRSELRKLADLEMQKNLASLLDGTTSMPSEMLAQLQSEIARFEAQNLSMPEKSPYELHTHGLQSVQNQVLSSGEGLVGRVWNPGHDVNKQQVREMLNRGVSGVPNFDQLSAKSESPNPNWPQDSLSVQTDVNRRSKVFAANADDGVDSALRPHNQSEKLADQVLTENLSRVHNSRSLSSHSLAGQPGTSSSTAFHNHSVMSSLWAGKHVPLDNDSSSAQVWDTRPPLFERAGSLKANHWDMDWSSKTDTSHAGELSSYEVSKTLLGHDLPGVVKEVRAVSPTLQLDGNVMRSNDSRDGTKQSTYINNDEHESGASLLGSGHVRAEDLRELLPSTYVHMSGDTQQARDDKTCSRLAVWSSDVKTPAKTLSSVDEILEVPRIMRNELRGVLPSMQGQMQAENTSPTTGSLPGSAVTWQRAPSPSLSKSSTPSHHVTTMRSTTPCDDEFFWDHTSSGNARQSSMAERHNKLFSQREQVRKVPDEGYAHLAFAAGSSQMAVSEFPSAVARPGQPIAKGACESKQTDEVPVLKPQGSLTVADAEAFLEWCEEQINLRRGLDESDCLTSDLALEAIKAEFFRHKDLMLPEAKHTSLSAAETTIEDKVVGVEAVTPDKLKKSSDGEEELDSESFGQSSVLKNAKKKPKKGKKIVDPALLGFSIASNRILMGEIQHVND